MNDTIVVFDRIRENIKIMRRETLGEVSIEASIRPEPDDSDFGTDVSDCAFTVSLWWRSTSRLLSGAGHRHCDRHIFLNRGRRSYAGLLTGLAGREEGKHPFPRCTGESSRQGVKKQDRKWSLREQNGPYRCPIH